MNKTSLKEIELFFSQNKVNKTAFKIDKCSIIYDPDKFVKSHINFLKSNKKNRTYLPYYTRLEKYYKHCIHEI